jgi:hypothetical protein
MDPRLSAIVLEGEPWTRTGFWTALFLLGAAYTALRKSGLPEEARRALAPRLVRAGFWAGLVFHALAAWRLVSFLRELRAYPGIPTYREYGPGLVPVLHAEFAAWSCLAAAVLCAGVVLLGPYRGRWLPGVLLGGFVAAVTWCRLQVGEAPADARLFPSNYSWEVSQLPLVLLSIPAAGVACTVSAVRSWRSSRSPDPARRRRARLWFAGSALLLLCGGILFSLARGLALAESLLLIGNRLSPGELERHLQANLLVPAVVAACGLLASLYGILALRPGPEARESAGGPAAGGDNPAP